MADLNSGQTVKELAGRLYEAKRANFTHKVLCEEIQRAVNGKNSSLERRMESLGLAEDDREKIRAMISEAKGAAAEVSVKKDPAYRMLVDGSLLEKEFAFRKIASPGLVKTEPANYENEEPKLALPLWARVAAWPAVSAAMSYGLYTLGVGDFGAGGLVASILLPPIAIISLVVDGLNERKKAVQAGIIESVSKQVIEMLTFGNVRASELPEAPVNRPVESVESLHEDADNIAIKEKERRRG